MPAITPRTARTIAVVVMVLGIVVLVFDAFLVVALVRQARALGYSTTEGVVTRSGVKTDLDADGSAHRLDVAYSYEVGGRQYTGERYSYGAIGTNTRAWHRIADEMPVGSKVRVFYDPDDPADAVLRPGPTGFHLFLLWFLTPFNILVLGGWIFARRHSRPAFGPRSVKPIANGYRVRLPGFDRAGCGAGCLLPVTFCGSFVWAIGFGFNPPVALAGALYLGAVTVAVLLALWFPLPKTWMEVDERARVVRFPPNPEPLEVPFDTIRDVVVRHEEEKDSEGNAQHEYHCDFVLTDEKAFYITTYPAPEAAEAFVAWLRARVGLTAPA